MPDIDEKLTAQLGYSPFLDSALIQFDKQILLTTPHILALPLNEVFFTCYYIHSVRHPAGQDYPDHQHDDAVEIQLCLDGEYAIEVAGQPPLTLHPGAGTVIMPGLRHRSRCIKKGVRLTARAAINGADAIQFTSELAEQAVGGLIRFDGRGQDMVICELFRVLLADTPNPWKYEIAGGLIRIWLGTILATCLDFGHRVRSAPAAGIDIGNRGNALCERASTFIYANFQRPLNIDEIAQHTGITTRHLNRLFKKHVGTSVCHTLRGVRLSAAFRMLSGNPKSSIKEAAYRVGFSSPSYFTQCFKQQYGILPTEVHLRLSEPLKDALKYIDTSRIIADNN